jgi:carbamoyl-phosphate synthase large subunit
MKMNILITCAGRRNYLIHYFQEILCGNGVVIAVGNQADATSLQVADLGIVVPKIHSPDYIDIILQIVQEHDIRAIISLNDHELPVLAFHKMELEQWGARLLLSDKEIVEICYDKWKTHLFFNSCGLNCPNSYLNLETAYRALKDGHMRYPIVLKPRWGSAAWGVNIVYDDTEFNHAYALLRIKIQKSNISTRYRQEPGAGIVFQQFIEGDEYGIDILNDFTGNHYASFARRKLSLRAGETDQGETVIDPGITELGATLGKAIGHLGIMDCDFILAGKNMYLLDLNPRFGGGYPFSHEAGINIPAIYLAWLHGESDVDKYNNYRANQRFSKYCALQKINMMHSNGIPIPK